MPVQRILNVVSDLLYGTIFTNYFAGRQQCAADQARDIVDIVFRGILSEREQSSLGGDCDVPETAEVNHS